MKKLNLFILITTFAINSFAQPTLESSAYPGLRLKNDNSQIRLYGDGQEKWSIGVTGGVGSNFILYDVDNGGTRFTIDETNGNMGIGTSSPLAKLHIVDQASSSVTSLQLNNRIKFGGDGVINWGSSATHGILSWGTGKALVGGKADKDLSLLAGGGEKMIIKTNGNIGIGNSSPKAKLDIYNNSIFSNSESNFLGDNIVFKTSNHPNGSYFGGLTWDNNNRRRAAIVAVKENDDSDHVGLAFFTRGTDGPGPMYESMRISRNGKVGIGTPNPTDMLTVAGNIHSQEVKVTVEAGTVPDYVFEENYPIKKIEEVEAYVKENKHLPEIPSANEIEKNGLQLGAMDLKLLQKIEELTLYLIEQNKTLKKQNEKIMELEREINELKK